MIYTIKEDNYIDIDIQLFKEFDISFRESLSKTERELTNILEYGIITESDKRKFSDKFRDFMKMVLKYLEKFINWLSGPFKKSVKEAKKRSQDNTSSYDDEEEVVEETVDRVYDFIVYKHNFNEIVQNLNTLCSKIQAFTINSEDELRTRSADERKELEQEYLDKYWIIISQILNYDIKDISDFNNYISYITETEEKEMTLSEFVEVLEDQSVLSMSLATVKLQCMQFFNNTDLLGLFVELNMLEKFVRGVFNIVMNITTKISSCINNLSSQYNKYVNAENDKDDSKVVLLNANESTIFSNVKFI